MTVTLRMECQLGLPAFSNYFKMPENGLRSPGAFLAYESTSQGCTLQVFRWYFSRRIGRTGGGTAVPKSKVGWEHFCFGLAVGWPLVAEPALEACFILVHTYCKYCN